MDSLTRLIREAAELGPERRDVPGADQAHEVWRRGQRRRLIRVTSTAAATLAVLAVVASLALGTSKVLPDQLLPADGGQRTGVTAYPERIGHRWWVRNLGETSDPIAALIQVGADAPEGARWQAVMADGGRYEIAGSGGGGSEARPAVSANGQRIAYLQMPNNSWLVHDLRTGDSWSHPEIRLPSIDTRQREADADSYALDLQSPSIFSPSGEAIAVSTEEGPVVLDIGSGSVDVVKGMVQAIGWIDDDRLVGRAQGSVSGPASTGDSGVDVMVWSRSTGVATNLGRVEFGESPNGPASLDGQWWGTVRDDRTLWLSLSQTAEPMPWLVGVSLPGLEPVDLDGKPSAAITWNLLDRYADLGVAAVNGELISWQRHAPVHFAGGDVRETLSGGNWVPTTVIDPSVGVQQIIWAKDALNGAPVGSVLGTDPGWWAWWWQEIALGVGAAAMLVWWRRHRSTPQ